MRRRDVMLGGLAAAGACQLPGQLRPVNASAPATAIRGARWFNGSSFEAKDGYSIGGRFAFSAPARIERTLELDGAFLVPPFADAHNHGIGTGDPARDRAMIESYIKAGVFYMQSMGNLPLDAAQKNALGLNAPRGVDAIFAQGSITGYGGHPAGIIRNVLLPQGYFPGTTEESLKDVRYYEIASEAELAAKWPKIRSARGDFIKFFLFNSEAYEQRRSDPAFFGRRGLDPKLAASVVKRTKAEGLRAAAHVASVADYRVALDSGADIIAHIPTEGLLSAAEAQETARRGVIVHTTAAFLTRLARNSPADSAAIAARQKPNLELLKRAGVRLAIGSDDPADPGPGELTHLRSLGVFSDLELLRMWTGETARTIFPGRRIGALQEGYEASFLALDGDPLADWSATGRMRVRFKQGVELG